MTTTGGGAYYNEHDPYAAAWLRNLIAANLIAPGDVDERSIVDVQASDLKGFTQWHLFAGIAGWSLALRLAGWPDDRSVLTASVPCQPFSAAGSRQGRHDDRNLWPHAFRLIRELRAPTCFGEQVEAAIGFGWLDRVFADLEGTGYACAAVDLPACSVGAPHIRQRLFWVADCVVERQRVSRESRGLPDALSVAVASARQGLRLQDRQQGEYLHAPGGSGDQAWSRDHGPYQQEQARQQTRESAGRIQQREQPQPSAVDGRRDSTRGAHPLAGLPMDRQEVPVARVLRDKRRGDQGQGRSVDGGWPDNNSDGASGERLAESHEKRRQAGAGAGAGREESERARAGGERVADAGRASDERGRGPDDAHGTHGTAQGEASQRQWRGTDAGYRVADGGLGDADRRRREEQRLAEHDGQQGASRRELVGHGDDGRLNHWKDAVWLPCLDGKARRVEPGIHPLAHGVPNRVGRLRAYGNAIVPQVAAEFVKAFMETR